MKKETIRFNTLQSLTDNFHEGYVKSMVDEYSMYMKFDYDVISGENLDEKTVGLYTKLIECKNALINKGFPGYYFLVANESMMNWIEDIHSFSHDKVNVWLPQGKISSYLPCVGTLNRIFKCFLSTNMEDNQVLIGVLYPKEYSFRVESAVLEVENFIK